MSRNVSHTLQRLALASGLVLWTATSAAQTPVLDPRYAEFEASADHSRLTPAGEFMVSRYDLEFYFIGAQQPFQTNSLGKPTPNSTSVIRVDLNATLTAFPPPGTTYEARVTAVGPTGAGRSLPSNQFAFTDPCAASIAPTGTSVGAAASTGSVAVTIAAGCSWSATSNESWVTITGGSTGSGSGSVSYSIAANTTTSPRTATLTIAGLTFSITQAAGCTFSISPTSLSISSGARTGTVSVTAGAGCGWTATSSASWIVITSGATGSGNGTVGYSIAANPSISPRTGTVTIAGRTFTVTQAGVPCTSVISPTGVAVAAEATTGTISVSIPSGCAWTATDNASWVSITGGASGTGNGTVAYSIAANPNTTERTATITAAGQTFTITQVGVICSISISPTASSPTHAGGSGTVTVTANAPACAWTAASNAAWITITGGASGSGNGSVSYTVAPNTSTSGRTGTIGIAGKTLTVTQAGMPCTYTISPTQASVAAAASTGTITVSAVAGCSWSASSLASWITITSGGSGSGNGIVTYSVTANPGITSRSATITVAGQSFTVTQAGVPCTYTLQPTGASVPAVSTTGTVSVSALAGCAWTASSPVSWVTLTGGQSGSGAGTVSYSVAANLTTSPRTGTLTIAGQPFTITQGGGSCTYTASPSSESFGAPGGSGTVTVTSQGGCAWTATTSASWITIGSGGSGTGSGTINYQVAPNTEASPRSGTIAVGGRVVTISQAAACDYNLSPSGVSIGAGAATGSFTVSTASVCGWTAFSSAAWLTLTGTTSGSGDGTIAFSAAANTGTGPRTATVTVAGRTFTVTQAAPACAYTLSTTNLVVSPLASTGTVGVTAGSGCGWTAVSSASWITVTGGATGSGNGTVTLSIAAYSGSASRSGTVTIAGRTVTVTQQGLACTTSISPSSLATAADASQETVTVTTAAGCSWTAVSNVPWITIDSGASGSGPGTVTFTIAVNSGSASRLGSLTIGGRTFFVSQAGRSCTFDINPGSVSIGSEGLTGTIAVSASTGCGWTASSSVTWISIVSGGAGTGDGTVTFSVAPNTGTAVRSGTITVAGRLFSIMQAGVCTFSVSPLSISIGTPATTSNVLVLTGTGCGWTAASHAPWISITTGQAGTGTAQVTLAIGANTGASSRTGTATIAGHTFTVNQSGCSYSVSPSSASISASGGLKSAFVSTTASCGWSASSDSPWITFPGASAGSGTSWVTYNVAANPSTTARTGTLTIAGRTLTVDQAAAPCTYSVTPTSVTVPNTGGVALVSVTSMSNCAWSASSNSTWVTIASGETGSGNGTVTLQAAPNPSTFARVGSVYIAGRLLFVTQKVSTPPSPPKNLRIVIP